MSEDVRIDPGDAVAVWATEQVTRLLEDRAETTSVPEYGTTEWLQLDADDPARASAIVTAAEQWRRHAAAQAHLDRLFDAEPDEWFREITADANAEARRAVRRLQPSRRLTHAEVVARRVYGPVRQLRPTPGWPPVRIPGGQGAYLTYSQERQAA